jgi:hypothetical protein
MFPNDNYMKPSGYKIMKPFHAWKLQSNQDQ